MVNFQVKSQCKEYVLNKISYQCLSINDKQKLIKKNKAPYQSHYRVPASIYSFHQVSLYDLTAISSIFPNVQYAICNMSSFSVADVRVMYKHTRALLDSQFFCNLQSQQSYVKCDAQAVFIECLVMIRAGLSTVAAADPFCVLHVMQCLNSCTY